MRRGLIIFLLINALILAFLAHSVFTLFTLLFEDGADDAIPRAELPNDNTTLFFDTSAQLIPKVLHQTYIDENIPAHWQPAQKSCIDLHDDYEYILWTDKKSRDFIAAMYPWFLQTFDRYPYPIQRADTIRYFILVHYGGIYLDLDVGCRRRLDPFLAYPAWLRRTLPTGISNDAMGAAPHHPFFQQVVDSLQSYDRHWLLPYVTIMYSTGPLFLSEVWKKWMNENVDRPSDWYGRVRVLTPKGYMGSDWAFFSHYQGSSWHRGDAHFIFWLGGHWMLVTAVGFLAAGVLGLCLWWIYGRMLRLGSRRRPHGGGGGSRHGDARSRLPLRWWSPKLGVQQTQYELLEQHDA